MGSHPATHPQHRHPARRPARSAAALGPARRHRPYARIIAGLVTRAHADPAFAAEYHERFVEPRRDQARALFQRAVERGEIPPETNIEVALDLIYGPFYHRLLHRHAPLNDRFTTDVIDMTLRGIQPAPTPEASPGN